MSASEELLVRLAAHEILLRRIVGELEIELPGLIDQIAGPYEPARRPSQEFSDFVAQVDDHISLLLSQVRADLADKS